MEKSEIWKPIKGYEGIYEISNYGRIKSIGRIIKRNNHRLLLVKPKILKQLNNGFYYFVNLYKEGKPNKYRVHRLVAEAFIPNPNNYPCVNHKDEDKTNNCVWNLEWCDYKYNISYGTRNERMIQTRKNNNSLGEKTIIQYTKNGDFICEYRSQSEASRQTGICQQNISKCCLGIYKTAGGFVWKYKQKSPKSLKMGL